MSPLTRHEFLRTLGAGAAAGVLPPDASASGPINIIFVLADDLGWHELGCYGNTFNETPHLDRLAARGVRFTDAYAAAPVCSPTRASIMTGQHPARVGITDYLRADDPKFLSADHYTIAKALGASGYHCGLIGKWHLMGDYAQRKGDPRRHGFQEVICSESSYIGPGYYFPPYQHMKEVQPRSRGEYLTDRLSYEAVEFITRSRQQPFFLFLSHYAPHTRLAGKPTLVEKYARKPGASKTRNNPELAAMLESVDEGIGLIGAALERFGIAARTAIVFTSDNGGEDRVTSNAPLRAGKSTLYEGGIRVPLLVAAPGFGRPGTLCHTAVTSMDLYPTFLEIAGVNPRPELKLDGVSLHRALSGATRMRERPLFWHYPLEKPHFLGGRSAGAVRQGDFKLIEFYEDGKAELYNLKDDPGESSDLSSRHPGKKQQLLGLLHRWRESLRP